MSMPVVKHYIGFLSYPCHRKGCRFKKRNGRCCLKEIRIQGKECLEFEKVKVESI